MFDLAGVLTCYAEDDASERKETPSKLFERSGSKKVHDWESSVSYRASASKPRVTIKDLAVRSFCLAVLHSLAQRRIDELEEKVDFNKQLNELEDIIDDVKGHASTLSSLIKEQRIHVDRMRMFSTAYMSPMKAQLDEPTIELSTPRDPKKQRRG